MIRHSSELGEVTIAVIDGGPSGDEVLDQVLYVLGGGRVVARAREVSRSDDFGDGARGRGCSETGRVGPRDLMRWWEGCWTCRELGQLSPTLLRQLLTLYEELWAVHKRLHERIGIQPAAHDFGVDAARCRLIRDAFGRTHLASLRRFGGPHAYIVMSE